MTIHVDPEANILRARRRYVPRNTPSMRMRLDEAACKLTVELIATGARGGSFYVVIGTGELHLYSPRSVMRLAQDAQLVCTFVVDWHELKSNIADANPHASQGLRSEPASVLSPTDAGSPLCAAEASA